jgi:hypothetical protein
VEEQVALSGQQSAFGQGQFHRKGREGHKGKEVVGIWLQARCPWPQPECMAFAKKPNAERLFSSFALFASFEVIALSEIKKLCN